MGYFVLTQYGLYFKMQLMEIELSLPVQSLLNVGITHRMGGKNPLRSMLKVDYQSRAGKADALAFLVNDFSLWQSELSSLIKKNSIQKTMMINNQTDINQSEWEEPEHWNSVYFSKKDTRTWVPKQNFKQGWTLNLGSPAGVKWLYGLFALFFILGGMLGCLFCFLIMSAYY